MSIFSLKNFDIWPMTSVGGSDTGIKVSTRGIIIEYVENGVWFSTDFLKLHFHPKRVFKWSVIGHKRSITLIAKLDKIHSLP
jgi:hypothetical protein